MVQGLENAQLTGQQYATQDINNLLNERSSFGNLDVGTVQAQNNAAVQRALALNQQNLAGQQAAANAQLQTEGLNQGGQIANNQLTQSGLGQLNSFRLGAGGQMGNYITNQQGMALNAQEANAANQANLFGGLLGGGLGLANVFKPSLNSMFGSGGFSNINSTPLSTSAPFMPSY